MRVIHRQADAAFLGKIIVYAHTAKIVGILTAARAALREVSRAVAQEIPAVETAVEIPDLVTNAARGTNGPLVGFVAHVSRAIAVVVNAERAAQTAAGTHDFGFFGDDVDHARCAFTFVLGRGRGHYLNALDEFGGEGLQHRGYVVAVERRGLAVDQYHHAALATQHRVSIFVQRHGGYFFQ